MGDVGTQESVTLTPATDSQEPSMADSLRPVYCIRRSNNIYVPLIPVDQLPTIVQLKGIPISLNQEEVLKMGMRFCGEHADHDGSYYQVELPNTAFKVEANDAIGTISDNCSEASDGTANLIKQEKTFVEPNSEEASRGVNGGQGHQHYQANNDDTMSNASGSLSHTNTSSKLDKRGVKQYCTHWIRTGNCDYIQEGCKYKHVIPDIDTLREIGIRTFPRWVREDPSSPLAEVTDWRKPNAAFRQDWRRQNSQPAHVELPESPSVSHRPAFPHVTSPAPGFVHHQPPPHSPRPVVRQPNQPFPVQQPAFMPLTQHFPAHATYTAQHQPRPQAINPFYNPMNSPFQSATTESYKRQSQPFPSATSYNHQPHSAMNARSSLPPTQPPISRPAPTVQPVPVKQPSAAQEAINGFVSGASVPPDYRVLTKMNEQNNGAASVGMNSMQPLIPSPDSTRPVNVPPYTPNRTPVNHPKNGVATFAAGFNQNIFATHGIDATKLNGNAPAKVNSNTATNTNGMHSRTQSSEPKHRRLFVNPGEEQYVTNPPDEPKARSQYAGKKHGHSNGKAYGGKNSQPTKKRQGGELLVEY